MTLSPLVEENSIASSSSHLPCCCTRYLQDFWSQSWWTWGIFYNAMSWYLTQGLCILKVLSHSVEAKRALYPHQIRSYWIELKFWKTGILASKKILLWPVPNYDRSSWLHSFWIPWVRSGTMCSVPSHVFYFHALNIPCFFSKVCFNEFHSNKGFNENGMCCM